MKVLYLVFQALLGGHVLSASTIAREMQTIGVSPVFAGADGAMADIIRGSMPFESVNIPLYHGSRQTYFTWGSFAAVRRLRQIIKQHRIDLIHAFDARSYIHAYLAGLHEQIPVLCTLCGGVDPYYNLPAAPVLIVFSEEQKRKMEKTFGWPAYRVEVVRTRLDVREILSEEHFLDQEEALSYGLKPNLAKVMMVSSFDSTKVRSISKVLEATEELFSKGISFQLILIGGKGECHERAREQARLICGRYGDGRVILTGPIMRAFRLLQLADIVLGVGRSAFEGMVYGKPTLIVGEQGYAGVVAPESIEALAWYNFSGRNQSRDVPAEELSTSLVALLSDADRRQRLGAFGREFILNEIDVTRGAKRIDAIYHRLTDQGPRIAPWRQNISLACCLAPIIRDNTLHTLKGMARQIFAAICS